MKILHTADIHLNKIGDERWDALKELIVIGKKEKIEILVVSGDLFDKEIDAENLRPKIREIFSNNGFDVILLPGNHDSDVYKDMYFGEDAHVLTDPDTCFEHEKVKIWGMPFQQVEEETILQKIHRFRSKLTQEYTNIILYHGELLDAFFSRKDFGDEGERRYMPVKLSYFRGVNVDYILGGHFHSSFDVRTLENGGYFVYPGSPISITKREKGQRSVNLFETGKSPKQYLINTPHYEEITVELDPLADKNPAEVVEACLKEAHSNARIILIVKGFINSEKTRIKEIELAKQIKQITNERCIEERLEFRDIHMILEDDLFKSFMNKIAKLDLAADKKKQMCEIAIKAMMEAKS